MAERLSDHPDYQKFVPLKKWEFGFLVHFQQGLCGCGCGEPLEFGTRMIREEHLHQRATGGKHDVLKNVALWRVKPCALAKDKRDALERKKLRSLAKMTKKSQAEKKAIPAHVNGIQSRGFRKKSDAPYSNTRVDD